MTRITEVVLYALIGFGIVTMLVLATPPATGDYCAITAQEVRRAAIAYEQGTPEFEQPERKCQR